MPKCKTCDADIVWVESQDGRKHPLDDRLLTVAVTVGEDPLVVRFIQARSSHFATCPQADAHRKRTAELPPRGRERRRARAGRQCAFCEEFVEDNQPGSIRIGRDTVLCGRKCEVARREINMGKRADQ